MYSINIINVLKIVLYIEPVKYLFHDSIGSTRLAIVEPHQIEKVLKKYPKIRSNQLHSN